MKTKQTAIAELIDAQRHFLRNRKQATVERLIKAQIAAQDAGATYQEIINAKKAAKELEDAERHLLVNNLDNVIRDK